MTREEMYDIYEKARLGYMDALCNEDKDLEAARLWLEACEREIVKVFGWETFDWCDSAFVDAHRSVMR